MVDNNQLITRIRKIKGQIEGVERMVKEGRGCLEVVQQISAARSALAKVGGKLLAQESCLLEKKKKPKNFERMIGELVKNL